MNLSYYKTLCVSVCLFFPQPSNPSFFSSPFILLSYAVSFFSFLAYFFSPSPASFSHCSPWSFLPTPLPQPFPGTLLPLALPVAGGRIPPPLFTQTRFHDTLNGDRFHRHCSSCLVQHGHVRGHPQVVPQQSSAPPSVGWMVTFPSRIRNWRSTAMGKQHEPHCELSGHLYAQQVPHWGVEGGGVLAHAGCSNGGLWQHSGNHAWKMPAHPICTRWLREGVVLHPPLSGAATCSVVSAVCDDMRLVLPAHHFDREITLLLLPPRNCLHPSGPACGPALPKRAGKQALLALRSQHHLKNPGIYLHHT